MPIHIKTMLFGVSVAVAIGFATSNSAAQSTGPAALAAKQRIKTQVLSAMANGKISQAERRDILSNAKDILSAQEYSGLVQTINRLSPPDRATPENLGYAPFIDKQLMAKFPTVDLSWIEKSPLSNTISRQSFAKATMPKQTVVVKEIITKQTKETVPKQSIAKTTKSNAISKVVILPPPPQQKNNKQPKPSTVGSVQNKSPKSDKPTSPPPPTERSQTRNATADKPVQQKVAESPKKRPVTGDQATIQQPEISWNNAEKSAIKPSYSDYSVPVLTTPAAALLSDRKSDTIKTSFDEPLEPESCQGIIR